MTTETWRRSGRGRRVAPGRIDVREYGAISGTDSTAAIQTAVTAAAAGGEVYFPPGNWITAGISFNGVAASIKGEGDTTIIRQASGATGALLDFTGAVTTSNAYGHRPIGHFRLIGNSSSNTANHGIKIADRSGFRFDNISIQDTGGSCIRTTGDVHFTTFSNIVLGPPSTGNSQNTPYLHTSGSYSANQMYNIGLRSASTTPDPLHCIVFEDDGTYAPYGNNLYGWWTEYQHLKEGGSIVRLRGAEVCNIEMPMMSDCSTVDSAPTDACVVRLDPLVGGGPGSGGNYVWGQLYGDGDSAYSIPYGIVVAQSRNRIQGTLGYAENAVWLKSGVDYCHVSVGGRASGTTQNGVRDDSGTTTNTVLDDYGTWRFAAHTGISFPEVQSKRFELEGFDDSESPMVPGTATNFVLAPLRGTTSFTVTNPSAARAATVSATLNFGRWSLATNAAGWGGRVVGQWSLDGGTTWNNTAKDYAQAGFWSPPSTPSGYLVQGNVGTHTITFDLAAGASQVIKLRRMGIFDAAGAAHSAGAGLNVGTWTFVTAMLALQ